MQTNSTDTFFETQINNEFRLRSDKDQIKPRMDLFVGWADQMKSSGVKGLIHLTAITQGFHGPDH